MTSTGFHPLPGAHKMVLAAATPLAPKHSEASAIHLQDGAILLLWTEFLDPEQMPAAERPPASPMRRSPTSDDGYARISGMRSEDGGYTWSKPWVVVDDRDARINCMSPALARLADGRLLLAYSWRSGGNHLDNEGSSAKRVRISDDEGQSWSEPVQITPDDSGYHTGCHDRALTLPSGRVLVQCHTLHPGAAKRMSTYVAYSDDNGRSWRHSNFLSQPISRGFEEACIVPREDGSLLMVMRSWRGQSFYSESTDDGATWSVPYPSGVVTPDAPTLLARLPASNDLLMVWNSNYVPGGRHTQTRCPLLSAISKDGGRTWGLPKAIEVDPSYEWGYPGVLFHEDRALLHYFRRRVDGDAHREVVLAHIPLDWFYDATTG